jgi:two-component system, cell cycle sensor histidine kinase and response regulator CckA
MSGVPRPRRISPVRCAIVSFVVTLMISSCTWAKEGTNPPKRVLILYSFDNEEGIYGGLDRALRSELRSQARDPLELYTEYLDLIRFPSATHPKVLVKLLKLKFSGQKPDLIVPVSHAALRFLLGEGKELFPGTPIVALFNVKRLDDWKQEIGKESAGRSITGVASADEPARTLDLALRLQPDTKQVVIVVGSSPVEKYWLEQLKQDFSAYNRAPAVTYLTDLPMNELLRRVAGLPPHTVILSTFYFEDGSGQFFLPEEALDLITRAASDPVYGIYSTYIGHGVVGGRMTDPEKLGRQIAALAGRVLNGESTANLPVVVDNSAQDMVDWRQLQRWGISEKRLPASAVELFREPSVWERYRYYIVASVSFCLLETILILALIFSRQKRRRAEKALLHEKALADAVIEGLPGLFFLQDKAGRNLRWNKNAETVVRYPPSEVGPLRQVGPLGNVADEYKGAAQQAREETFERGSGHVEAEILAKEGRRIPYYFTSVKVELEGTPYLACIGLDMTGSKQAEAAVRRSESELRSFVEHAPYGIGAISVRQDRFLRANPALVKMLGYKSEAEVLALTISHDLYSEGQSGGFRAQLTRADYFNAVEFTWKRKDGKPVSVRASGRRISRPEQSGDILEIMAEDVTARRILEEQLRHAQKMEALGQLAGSVAHDFNNLLGVIIGYCELLSSDANSEGLNRARLATIKKAGESAASLTAQLLAFSRRQALQLRVLNLNTLVAETQKMLQRLMGEDIEQKIVLDPNLGKTKADPSQMVQVIMNLVVNARDAMPQGGKLTIETANVVFAETAVFDDVPVPPGRYVMIAVSDTGIGMDAETRARIFEPFFTTKPVGKGTGLGLATVYGIVKQSGGYVFADSDAGQGTTFRVYLPQIEQAVDADSPPTAPVEVRQGSETILVVEDEPDFRNLLRDGLQARGYTVLIANNGVDALRVAEQHKGPIRLLLTDVIMPEMSGPELAKCLKETRPDIDVLYMSGYTDDKVANIAELDGKLALIQKPFYMSELVQKLHDILSRRSDHSSRLVAP